MNRLFAACLALAAVSVPNAAFAEQADYNQIELTGLSRDVSWPLNRPGETRDMVCNVNGEDGFLSVRAGPGAEHPVKRRLRRLAIVEVDTKDRRGNWVRVLGAHRSFSEEGVRQEYRELPVTGWAHDGYLCSFIDYPAPGDFDGPAKAKSGSSASVEGSVTLAQTNGKPARCEWNNGNGGPTERYACQFQSFDDNGSFSVVRDDGYELMLEIEGPGMGTLLEFGDGRLLGDFGRVRRSASDPACWEAENGDERLCAR